MKKNYLIYNKKFSWEKYRKKNYNSKWKQIFPKSKDGVFRLPKLKN